MIDYLEISIQCKHMAIGNILRNIDEKTGEIRDYRKEFLVKNKFQNSLRVKSNFNGQEFKIKGNFVKFLQGHNIFGSNDLVGICHEVVKVVLGKLDVPITDIELNKIKHGEFSIHMVDIAWNYRQDPELIPKIIHEVGSMWRSRDNDASNYGSNSVYLKQDKKSFAFKIYNKKVELAHKPLPLSLPNRERLLKYSTGLLRSELRLRSMALRKLRLSRGTDWSQNKVSELIDLALKQAEFNGSIYRRLIPDNVMKLKPRLRQAYVLWEEGHNLSTLYDQQVLRRIGKAFMEIGVDIRKPLIKIEGQAINIASCFSEDKKLNYPKWAVKDGLIFKPKKKKVV